MRDYFDTNVFTVNINNTSIFSNDSVKKGIDRLMSSPILDFICSMPDDNNANTVGDNWEKFQKEFFDYYYESFKKYSGEKALAEANEVGFNRLRKEDTLLKMEERLLYDENADVKDYLDWCEKYNQFKESKKKTNNWCFLGKEEYEKELKEKENKIKNKYESSEFGRLTENMIDRLTSSDNEN